jgi:hypothetical protein
MIKIVCISTELPPSWTLYRYNLELYKIYDGDVKYEGLHKGYLLSWLSRFDAEYTLWFPADNFMTLAEWRDKQINEILEC